jgi:thioredoxin-like negative regulator of GroEL
LTTGRVRDADGVELRAEIESGRRLLVEFWAPWCVQCGPMAGVVERVAETLPPDVSVLKVSVEDEAVAAEYDVQALPAVALYVDGRAATSISGFRRAPALLEALRPHLAP